MPEVQPIALTLQETLKEKVVQKVQSTLEKYGVALIDKEVPFTYDENHKAWGTRIAITPAFDAIALNEILEDFSIAQFYGAFSPRELAQTGGHLQSTHTVLFYFQYDSAGKPITGNAYHTLSTQYKRELEYIGKLALEIAKDAPKEIKYDFERTFFNKSSETGVDEEFKKILISIDSNSLTKSIQDQILVKTRDYINEKALRWGTTRCEPLHTFIAHILMVAYSHVPRLKKGKVVEEPNGIKTVSQLLESGKYADSVGLKNFLNLLEYMRIMGNADKTEFIRKREYNFLVHAFRKQDIFLEKREGTFLSYNPCTFELGDLVELEFFTQEEWNDCAESI